MSVNNSNFTSFFFKQSCHANPGVDKTLAVYLQAIMYHFEHTSHDNRLDFLVQVPQIFFEHVCSLYQ